eukprot:6185150-Pleurochrysis_carterae.AAC.1
MGERLGWLIIKFLPAALAGEGRVLNLRAGRQESSGQRRPGDRGHHHATREDGVSSGPGLGKGFNKKGMKAVAAAAATRKNDSRGGAGGNAPGGRPPYKLPDGQWCSKGTCHFTHDQINPGEPCYRDPLWPGYLPDKVLKNKQQVE